MNRFCFIALATILIGQSSAAAKPQTREEFHAQFEADVAAQRRQMQELSVAQKNKDSAAIERILQPNIAKANEKYGADAARLAKKYDEIGQYLVRNG